MSSDAAARRAIREVLDGDWNSLVRVASTFMVQAEMRLLQIDEDDRQAAVEAAARVLRDELCDEGPPAGPLEALQRFAAQQAREGFDIRGLVRGFHGATEGFADRLLELFGRNSRSTAIPSVLLNLVTTSVTRAQARISDAVLEGFEAGAAEAADPDDAPCARFVDLILYGEPTPDSVERAGREAGVGVDGLWMAVLVLARLPLAPSQLRAAAQRVAAAFEGSCAGGVLREPAVHVPVLVPLGDSANGAGVAAALELLGPAAQDRDCVLLCAPNPAPLLELRGGYDDVRNNTPWIGTIPWGGPILDSALLFLVGALATISPRDRARIFHDTLGPLLNHPRGPEYLELLDILGAVGEQQQASQLLGKQASWASERLQEIQIVIGRSWRDNWGRWAITTAIVCRWIAAQSHEYVPGIYGAKPRLGRLVAGGGVR